MKKIHRLIFTVVTILFTISNSWGQAPFITTWQTTSVDESITIPTTEGGYSYTVDWGDGTTDETVYTGNATHEYATANIYTVSIAGDFPRIYFNFGGDRNKILTVEQWGDIAWTSMVYAFLGCANLTVQATDAPNLSGVTSMTYMFSEATTFNQPLNHWDVSSVTDMNGMFAHATSFNQPLNNWDVSNVTDISSMFQNVTSFNQPLGDWDVSSVTEMAGMFYGAMSFDQPLNDWDVSSVTNMAGMFYGATSFDQPLDNWDVSSVTNMQQMFFGNGGATAFNQPLNEWDVSNVTDMTYMFAYATNFDGDLSTWDVSSVTEMYLMFYNATSFNQPLNDWVVSNVTNMAGMFYSASSFNQDLSDWDISSIFYDGFNSDGLMDMLGNSGLSTLNYQRTVNGWATLDTEAGETQIPANITLGADGLSYCDAAGRDLLTDTYGWTINDAGQQCLPFITTWKTDNNGTSDDNQITIPTTGSGYDYNVYWEDINNAGTNGTANNQSGDVTITFPAVGTYRVEVNGNFPRIYFNFDTDYDKILTVEQWGDIAWESMGGAFAGCSNLTIPATDAPYLSGVTDMSFMFQAASSFNEPIGHWDVSTITDMTTVFDGASSFNQDISDWNTANVEIMVAMFVGASSFNQDIGGWTMGNVINANQMFWNASSFNQDLGDWEVGNMTGMADMLSNCGLSRENYDNTLIGWATQTLQPGVPLGVGGLTFCDGSAARATLTGAPNNWTITGDDMECSQSITFDALPDRTYGEPDFELTATASSGLEVSYVSSDETVAILDGNTLSILKIGATTITASQAGNDDYLLADNVEQILTVIIRPITVSAEALQKNYGDDDPALTYTITSGNLVGSDEVTGELSREAGEDVGDYEIFQNTLTAGSNYTLTYISDDLTISTRPITITADDQSKTYGEVDPELTYTITSGNLVDDDELTGELSRDAGEDVGTYAILQNTLSAGDNYDISFVSADFTITKADQTISFDALQEMNVTDEDFELTATSSSELPVSYESSNSLVAIINGNVVSILSGGETTITAGQPGNNNFNAASPVEQILVIVDAEKTNQSITFTTIPDKTEGDAPFDLSATASSGLEVVFSVVSGPATINGNTLTLTGPGTVNVMASQAGDETYHPAEEVERSFCSNPAKPAITVQGEDTESPTLVSSATAGNQWFKGAQPLSGETGTTLVVDEFGIYRVQVTIDGCSSEISSNAALVITGDVDTMHGKVIPYPNPVTDMLHIGGISTPVVGVMATDATGKAIEMNFHQQSDVVRVPVSNLAVGNYILRIAEREKLHQVKFIKK